MQDIDLGNVVGEVNPDSVIEFETPSEYTELSSGDSIKTIFGKTKRGLEKLNIQQIKVITDLDEMTTEGRYWLDNDIGSGPIMDTAWLTVKNDVISGSSINKSTIYQHLESALTTEVWYRYGIISKIDNSISWGVWKKVLTSADIANNLLTTNPEMALGADMGKALNDRLNSIAEYGWTDAVTGSVAAGTWTNLQTVTLSKGTYLLTGKMQVAPSGTGAAFAVRFAHESEYVSQVFHSVIGMALEKTSHIVVGDTPVTVTLTGYSTIVANYNATRIRWLKINKD